MAGGENRTGKCINQAAVIQLIAVITFPDGYKKYLHVLLYFNINNPKII